MNIKIYTDGSCSPNPGRGGWAFVAKYELNGVPVEKTKSGFSPVSTNNQMEMTAVLEAFRAIKSPGHNVTIVTDSNLVIGWLDKGWNCNVPEIVVLRDEILKEMSKHTVQFEWVKGHIGEPTNERVDQLAVEARK